MSHSEDKNRRPHCSDLQEPFVHRTPLPPGGAAPLPAGGRRRQRARHARGHARQRRGSRRGQPRAARRKALSRARSVTSQPPCPAGVTHPADVEPRAHSPDVARSSGRNPGPRGTRPRTGARRTHRGSDSGPRALPTKTTPTCDMSREIVRRQSDSTTVHYCSSRVAHARDPAGGTRGTQQHAHASSLGLGRAANRPGQRRGRRHRTRVRGPPVTAGAGPAWPINTFIYDHHDLIDTKN